MYNGIELTVGDNGIGLPGQLSLESSTSFGLQIISNLVVMQLSGEISVDRNNGTQYDVALTIAPLFNSEKSENCIGFVTVHRDITPLKEAERSKNEFVSNVSHELRTPLSVITLISDNLEALYDRLPDRRRLKMVRDIQKHTQILNDLIGDVLAIKKPAFLAMQRN